MPADAPGKYLQARLTGGLVAAIGSQPGAAPGGLEHVHLGGDADETAAKVREAGGSVLSEPIDIFDSGRMAWFADPEGAAFGVWQPDQHRGAAVVNEPGSLNFNGLHTRDLEGAKAFYGAVFGWDALPMGMWALPAYGDHLEALNPDARADARVRRAGPLRGGGRGRQRDRRRPARHAGALGRHVRRRRRRRDRRAGRGARRDGGRAAVRRAVDPRRPSSATPRARRSTRTSSCPRTRTWGQEADPPATAS